LGAAQCAKNMPHRVWGVSRFFLFVILPCAIMTLTDAAIAARPSCLGKETARSGTAANIGRFGALVLRDGRAVRLEGIRLPLGRLDHAPEKYARDARSALGSLAKGQTLQLAVRAPEQDRYGQIRAQIFAGAGDIWLQQELVRRGLARVDIAPLHPECATELYAAEYEARAARRGLWSDPAYAVRDPNRVSRDLGTFQIVQGKVISAAVRKGHAYLDFGEDWRSDFTVVIAPEDLQIFRAAGVDPLDYEGKTVRVRGIVDTFHGPEMAVGSPASIEMLKQR
jgi:micrococcal nuclease